MVTKRLLLVPVGAVLIAALSYGYSAFASPAAPQPPQAPEAAQPSAALADPVTQVAQPGAGTAVQAESTTDTDARIEFWQDRIKANPTSDTQYQYLGELLALKGRETGDVAQYALAATAFEKAIELYPGNVAARSGLAINLVTLHQWSAAIEQGKQILQTDLRALGAVAVIGDASLEIGDLDTARAAYRTLRQKADGPSVESRFARIAYLTGDSTGAVRILDAAASTAEGLNGSAEELAFYHYSAGEYRFNTGDVDGADREYSAALRQFPRYYLAIAGQGRVAFARGDLAGAIDAYERAVAIIPKPELLAYLGDLYALNGDPAAAESQYEAVDFILALGETQAQVFNREIALFEATHRRDTGHAVEMTRAELETRKDIYGYDAFAWALFNDGQTTEALDPALRAVSLGTQDPKLLYHLGMIELANGRTADGRQHLTDALALNPAFDPLGAAAAREALGR
jgi:tetratricopeptide (TPR) repeat protein